MTAKKKVANVVKKLFLILTLLVGVITAIVKVMETSEKSHVKKNGRNKNGKVKRK